MQRFIKKKYIGKCRLSNYDHFVQDPVLTFAGGLSYRRTAPRKLYHVTLSFTIHVSMQDSSYQIITMNVIHTY